MKERLIKFLLFASGIGIGYMLSSILTPTSGVFSVDSEAEILERKIDSGKAEILRADSVRFELTKDYTKIERDGFKYIDSIKSLHPDSGLLFLRMKLGNYANK